MEPRRETRESRPRYLTNGNRKRSRSNSTPPDRRPIHDNTMQQRPGLFPVSADYSRAFAQSQGSGRTAGSLGLSLQIQSQGPILVNGLPATQFATNPDPRPRRNSVSHTPAHTPRRLSISSPVDRPVIPGVTTNVTHVPNRLRRDSYRRPRILFYHKHEPYYGFTNFSDHPVEYQGKRYPTSEHLFQSFKVCGILCKAFAPMI